MPLSGDYAHPVPGMAADQLAVIDTTGDTRNVDILGRPVVVFTVRGAKSGLLRRVPLMKVEHGGWYAAVASRGGAPEHPSWYHSMKANPHVEIHDGLERGDFVAHEVTGEERAGWWEKCVAAFPNYAEYAVNAAKSDRLIPVFVCRPAETAHEA